MILLLYQTLQDRENPVVVQDDGPFKCTRNSAWLGFGYYFWDTHYKIAQWWGVTSYGRDSYIICRADALLDETCWDLHGNGRHREEFVKICDELVQSKLTTREKLLVPQVIEYYKLKKQMKYKAIRALGTDTVGGSSDGVFKFRMRFVVNHVAELDLYPPVQVCLIEKMAVRLSGYKLVFPARYTEEIYA